MPKGPQGQKRPADVTQNAVHVMRIATGEAQESPTAKTVAEESGSKGGKARAAALPSSKRKAMAKAAAAARWGKK